ncbi:hypothetical protein [Helicobacter ailurogastricus]|uniref:Uncharacterized protein n=1 Tax=Helicobacter ailurogastricus TaxID=1578720 RepID=A0A0K2XC38_9HELI|nr:hypothetical protein [Helicobacter ailurogastricus]CRF40615.1 hypothetical protein HAL011_03770 [Helicobacter ailurogastricus]CRF42269.1 hypothetical protein HAL013_04360 [Helicobacter ailurogastricus]CRF44221.1 hypothetical protein HAL09_07960 [Helicobacter ailurogastricus]BDQ28833.1 hypothetical protein ASB7_06700 [Helicobacter ailurogastricus]GMB89706.1 Putative membrane protein [Helicobacter ailurogastricus]
MSGWIVLCLVLVLLWFLLKDFFGRGFKQKIAVVVFLGVLAASLGLYTYKQDKINQEQVALQRDFLRGLLLDCDGVKVSQKDFSLVTGTLSFLGKQNTPMQGILVDLQSCKLAK